ncbi:MAG: D-alanine--D-alanine ligase [Phototrophicales bacterium]|nr:MAG: D-alanine--D-alanine ligase [Phototrophicales bacterium]RMG75316.1 MAG: D-alanine--D-alanine ligase [Chloroflexota bacterium]
MTSNGFTCIVTQICYQQAGKIAVSTKRKTVVAVIFGGRSVEHDVSVVTGNQIMQAFDRERYEVIPVYITRDGKWFTGEPLLDLKNYQDEVISHKGVVSAILSPSVQHHGLIINPIVGRLQKNEIKRVDVIFPAIHGSHGEDGTLQGLIELADIPYVGCGVLSSAIANDKAMTKTVLKQHGIPVIDGVIFTREDWLTEREAILARIKAMLTYPIFVKPATLGSSIGVSRVQDDDMLSMSIDIAASFDRRVIVEQGIVGAVEINCAVMGYGNQIEASVLEQPVSWEEFLTYEEKYMRGGGGMKSAERVIPAALDATMTKRVQDLAIQAFKAIDGRGTARIDFMVDEEAEKVYLNEINTMPGSLAFYLWHEMGMSQSDVVDRLVKLAQDAYADKRRNTYNYQTSLIELTAMRGLKGTKGGQSIRQDVEI